MAQSATQVDLAVSGTVNFTDNSNPPATSWFWDFGDGNTSNQQNPSHTYTAIGTYTVMFVTNPGSTCSDTTYSSVEVIDNTVGLDDLSGHIFEVYPNPTNGWVNLHLVRSYNSPATFSVYNHLGEVLITTALGESTEIRSQVNLRDLAAGIYYFRVEYDDQMKVQKVVKR